LPPPTFPPPSLLVPTQLGLPTPPFWWVLYCPPPPPPPPPGVMKGSGLFQWAFFHHPPQKKGPTTPPQRKNFCLGSNGGVFQPQLGQTNPHPPCAKMWGGVGGGGVGGGLCPLEQPRFWGFGLLVVCECGVVKPNPVHTCLERVSGKKKKKNPLLIPPPFAGDGFCVFLMVSFAPPPPLGALPPNPPRGVNQPPVSTPNWPKTRGGKQPRDEMKRGPNL